SSTTASTRPSHARSNSTPAISGKRSTITGSRPMRKNSPGSAKSATVNPSGGAPNSPNASHKAFAFSVRLHQNIQVLGSTRLSMEADGIAADDQVFNVVGVEDAQEFFEFWEHSRRAPSVHKERR